MEPSIITVLNDQANHELLSAHCYEAMAYWCQSRDYTGFAKFFFAQAAEEREHGARFFKHLLDRGVQPKVGSIEAPRGEFTSLNELACYAQKLEQQNSSNIRQCYSLALEAKDFDSQPMLMWFIGEQVEEEAWAAKMITLVARAECAGSIYALDRHIVKEFEDG
ncbi:ferritin [Ruficoccus amylovorans]|uniref:Ferritin n=1 Tax=Ruficoccus amylovorans TaxID=1804625 RepID=A0A842HBE3_9BACT|nr:ferritin [Ruficoccus amylovorans]MBC2592947.1 ferritin [Ruficoccus amylovorans]